MKIENIYINYLVMAGIGFLAWSCGPLAVTSQENYSFDGVKLISADIQDPGDPSTWTQQTYTVSPTRRLLLRYESLESHVQSTTVDGKNPVRVELTPVSADQADNAKSALSLCPVTRKWNNNATWNAGYPYGSSGRWNQPGGDYDPSGCTKATGTDGRSLVFDVTQWYINYPRGRGKNYGLILLSDQSLGVYGDLSGSYSPRILWSETSALGP